MFILIRHSLYYSNSRTKPKRKSSAAKQLSFDLELGKERDLEHIHSDNDSTLSTSGNSIHLQIPESHNVLSGQSPTKQEQHADKQSKEEISPRNNSMRKNVQKSVSFAVTDPATVRQNNSGLYEQPSST
jgi:hypothetical protein